MLPRAETRRSSAVTRMMTRSESDAVAESRLLRRSRDALVDSSKLRDRLARVDSVDVAAAVWAVGVLGGRVDAGLAAVEDRED